MSDHLMKHAHDFRSDDRKRHDENEKELADAKKKMATAQGDEKKKLEEKVKSLEDSVKKYNDQNKEQAPVGIAAGHAQNPDSGHQMQKDEMEKKEGGKDYEKGIADNVNDARKGADAKKDDKGMKGGDEKDAHKDEEKKEDKGFFSSLFGGGEKGDDEKKDAHKDDKKGMKGGEGEGKKASEDEEEKPGQTSVVPPPADWNVMYPPPHKFRLTDPKGRVIDDHPNQGRTVTGTVDYESGVGPDAHPDNAASPRDQRGFDRSGHQMNDIVTANPGTNPGTSKQPRVDDDPKVVPPAPILRP